MKPEPDHAKTIFLRAIEGQSPENWEAYLDGACGNDAPLRSRVAQLLKAHQDLGSFHDAGGAVAGTIDMPADQPISAAPGTQIGPYKLLQQIGEGGMGTVYMAEQAAPVRRKVALKIIKPGMDTREVTARFQAERQALALMDHPNIASVFDGGATEAGRPYFVMELVRGVPLTDYCDQNNLPVHERLELFITVCHAVQHAHQKGIIHRDIKPSNVLVTLHDGRPVPKVIDFGVAKAIGQQLTDKTLFTQFAQMVGTPLYMSPEQAQLSGLDVDTRGDIYSLGVMLYELLTGTTPFERGRVKQAAIEEIRRMIRDEEPPRPSTRLSSTAGEAQTAVAAHRHIDHKGLRRLVRGDLDWIVMKALEKDRTRRYETANGFARDVERYLADEPVQACPPSSAYRFRKFARRNRGTLATVAVVAVALVLGTVVSTWQAIRAMHAEDLAKTGLEKETAARTDAVNEAKQKETALAATRKSERAKSENLWQALVNEARANRLSRRSGQRFESLETLQRATQLARSLNLPAENFQELRNAVIATLAVPDLYMAGTWNLWPGDASGLDFDETHALYARTDHQGNCSIRRVANDTEIHRLPGLGGPAVPSFSRDGKFVAVHHPDSSHMGVQVWQLDGSMPRQLLSEAHAGSPTFRESQQVALAYDDGTIGVFELPSGRPLSRLAPETLTRPCSIALHPTEPLFAVASYYGSVVQVRDVETGKVLASLRQAGRAMRVAWHPDGRTLAVGYESKQILLYDRTTWQAYRALETRQAVTSIDFDRAGDRLAVTGWAGIVELFDVGTGQKLMATPPVVAAHRFSRDGLRLAGAVQDGKVGIWQIGGGREFRTLVHNASPEKEGYFRVAVHPDGQLLAVATSDGFGLWDLASGGKLAFIPSGDSNNRVLFEPSGALLTLSNPAGLSRWPIRKELNAAGEMVIGPPEPLPLPFGHDLSQSHDGRVIVTCERSVGGQQAYAGGWILRADRPKQPLRLDAGTDIWSIAVSPDGLWVVTFTFGGLTKVWDAHDGRLVKQLTDPMNYPPRVSPDGRWLGTTQDGRLIAVETWEPGPRVGTGAVFAPDRDSKLLAVPTLNGIRLVDQATGREVAMLEDPNLDSTDQVVFTPDGTRLIALNSVKGIHVWDLRLIRRQLKELGLDWDWPEFAPAEMSDKPRAPGAGTPFRIQVIRLYEHGVELAQKGLLDEAAVEFREAIRVTPDDVNARNALALLLNNQAWVLATHPEPKNRDAGRAVKLAREAVELLPNHGCYWNTLGVAHYRAGNWKEAIAALDTSLGFLAGEQESFNTFFLAMSHWQLEHKDEARTWYDRGVTWIEKNRTILDKDKPHDEELGRFRAEAQELLK